MPQPAPKQHQEMWVYIVILTLVIVALWGYFFKSYLLKTTVKEPGETDQSWGAMLNEIKQSINKSNEVFKQVKEDLQNLPLPGELVQDQTTPVTSSASTVASPELIQRLKDKIKNEANN